MATGHISLHAFHVASGRNPLKGHVGHRLLKELHDSSNLFFPNYPLARLAGRTLEHDFVNVRYVNPDGGNPRLLCEYCLETVASCQERFAHRSALWVAMQ